MDIGLGPDFAKVNVAMNFAFIPMTLVAMFLKQGLNSGKVTLMQLRQSCLSRTRRRKGFGLSLITVCKHWRDSQAKGDD